MLLYTGILNLSSKNININNAINSNGLILMYEKDLNARKKVSKNIRKLHSFLSLFNIFNNTLSNTRNSRPVTLFDAL